MRDYTSSFGNFIRWIYGVMCINIQDEGALHMGEAYRVYLWQKGLFFLSEMRVL